MRVVVVTTTQSIGRCKLDLLHDAYGSAGNLIELRSARIDVQTLSSDFAESRLGDVFDVISAQVVSQSCRQIFMHLGGRIKFAVGFCLDNWPKRFERSEFMNQHLAHEFIEFILRKHRRLYPCRFENLVAGRVEITRGPNSFFPSVGANADTKLSARTSPLQIGGHHAAKTPNAGTAAPFEIGLRRHSENIPA